MTSVTFLNIYILFIFFNLNWAELFNPEDEKRKLNLEIENLAYLAGWEPDIEYINPGSLQHNQIK